MPATCQRANIRPRWPPPLKGCCTILPGWPSSCAEQAHGLAFPCPPGSVHLPSIQGRNMCISMLNSLPGLAALLLIGACATPVPETQWPAEVPDRASFSAVWRSDAVNQPLQAEADYLSWVLRFYEG